CGPVVCCQRMNEPRITTAPHQVYRVARGPSPWQWTPWQYGPFVGRWDDPRGEYRMLYAAESMFTAYVEVLAQFRPDVSWLAEVEQVEGDEGDGEYPSIAPGVVGYAWVAARSLGQATLVGRHIDITAAATLAW